MRTLRATIRAEDLDPQIEKKEMPERLSKIFNISENEFREYLNEIERNKEFYEVFDSRWRELKDSGVLGGTAGRVDSKIIYVICRAVEPEVVIETGVRYGAFDAHILAALERNEKGRLYSIELPDSVNKYEVGYLIPDKLEARWELVEGDSKKILPKLLEDIGLVDLFLHDSLHRPSHMKREYRKVFPELTEEGVMASHDIMMTDTFQKFAEDKSMDWITVNNIGIGVKESS